ncbi:MAG TPA: insulinase family protein [Longimicrobiales bacterium]
MNRIRSRGVVAAALLVVGFSGAALAQEPERKEAPPPPLPQRPVAFPEFHERTLENGARVIVVENHEQPVVSLNLRLMSGSKNDPAGKAGVASFTATLLNKGTTTRTAEQIAESIDFVGGSLSASAGADWISVSSTVLTEFLDTALVLMADVVQNPTFPAEELETERTRTLSGLQASLGQPAFLAQRRFMEEVYGDHPYGAAETPESVRAITREDLIAFHREHFRPGNALFVVAGDVDPDDVVRRLERHFGDWSGDVASKATLPAPPARAARDVVLVHKPGAVQAVIRVGHLLPAATHPDWVALDVVAQILGGGTTGWFFQVLRQEKGYTYGAYVNAAQRVEPGYFQAWAEVRNEVADSALDEFFRLISRLRDEPVPAADLETAKNYMTGSFPLTIETPQQVANQIAAARLLGLPNDHVATYRDRVAAVTAEDVQRAAREHLHPDRAVVVVVGDATQILHKVGKFGVVRIVDADGRSIDPADLVVRGADVAFDGSAIEPATLVYDVLFQGNAVAQSTTTIVREEIYGVQAVRATTTMSGMGGGTTQEVAFEAATFRPLFATIEQQMGPQAVNIELRVRDGKVVGRAELPGAEPRDISVDAVPGMLLPGMDALAVQVADFATTKQFRVPMVSAQSGTVAPVEFKVVGETKVTVAAGEFDAYEVEVTGGPVPVRLFVRKAAPHVVLRQQMAGQPVSIELKELK